MTLSFIGPHAIQSGVNATGVGDTLDVHGYGTVAFQVSGTFSATVTFQGTVNGSSWFPISCIPLGGSVPVTSTTAAGIWIGSCAGLSLVRASVTWSSGTSVTVHAVASEAGGGSGAGGGIVPVATATLTNVSASASNGTILAANSARQQLIIFNDSAADLYIKYGSSSSTTSFTYKIPAMGTFTSADPSIYTGIITGLWTSATGAARITEVTA